MQTPLQLSVSEAAKIFGMSERTVRRALESKELEYIVVQGRYKISFPSLLVWAEKTVTVKNKLAKDGIGQFVDRWKIRDPKPPTADVLTPYDPS